ncbi:uncharacterized protein LOC110986653 [Acanthaster planci]|uniref:Uncharacterized protein LOC110986653 n=1 Tax=Acanthaster planci TaxID=133434 RepID=A0A8B7ZM19_ACAPL|nr:uncharacterized protein LOC110986653 [Acanthaster planci]
MICCAAGCGHKSGYGCHFYNFPSPNDGPDWKKWYDIWVMRINRVNGDGTQWRPETFHTKLCSCHFRAEDQWDPKSRKGGLKCKEPVFFDGQPTPLPPTASASHQQCADGTASADAISEELGLKRPWFVASSPNTSTETCVVSTSKKKTLQSHPLGKKKDISSFRSPRMPPLKIREYFEKQEEATTFLTSETSTSGLSTSSEIPRKQQYFDPNVRSLSTEPNTSDNCRRYNAGNWEAPYNPEVCEIIEVTDSDDNSQGISSDSSPIHQVDVKHEIVDVSDDFLPSDTIASMNATPHGHQTASPECVKLETDSSHLSDNGLLGSDREIIPQIVGVSSFENDNESRDQTSDQLLTELAQFVTKEHHYYTPRDNTEADPLRGKTPKAKISNVKPIRVISVQSVFSDSNSHKGGISLASQLGEQPVSGSNDTENLYGEVFNKLSNTGSGSHLAPDTVQTSASADDALNIANLLCDHPTSPQKTDLKLNQALDKIKELEKVISVERFGLHRYSGSDEKILFYSGFRSADMLMRFFWRIEPDDLASERSSKWQSAQKLAAEMMHVCGSSGDFTRKVIPYMDELFLFLCHVWLDLPPEDLAERFTLPSSSCAQFIILQWTYYLKTTLPSTAESTRGNSAPSKLVGFQGQYSNTRLLLHRMEIRVQQKSLMNHLSCLKLQGLVGFSPSGEIVFSSDLVSDATSNRDLLEGSGVLSVLQTGDGVIGEGDLMIESLFSLMGVAAHHLPALDLPHDPASLHVGSSGFDPDRCHVEVARLLSAKFVGSLTGFKCFQSVVLFPFAHSVTDLWEVCCRLVNYQRGHRSL